MNDAHRLAVLSELKRNKVFAILRGVQSNDIESVVQALVDGGIRILEVTFEHGGSMNNTLACVKEIVEKFNSEVICGVGTVTSIEQTRAAKSVGAQFVVSPNTDPTIIKLTRSLGMVSIPGAVTPTEAVKASNAGADYVKLFPVAVFGIEYFKAISEVLKSIPFIVVGGVNVDNAKDFLDAGAVGIGIGSYLVNDKKLANESLSNITMRAKKLVKLIQK